MNKGVGGDFAFWRASATFNGKRIEITTGDGGSYLLEPSRTELANIRGGGEAESGARAGEGGEPRAEREGEAERLEEAKSFGKKYSFL